MDINSSSEEYVGHYFLIQSVVSYPYHFYVFSYVVSDVIMYYVYFTWIGLNYYSGYWLLLIMHVRMVVKLYLTSCL